MTEPLTKIENTRALLSRLLPLRTRALPSLDQIGRSVTSILKRWPNAVKTPEDRDREKLAMEMLGRVDRWSWEDVTTQRVISAAVAVFDAERRDRSDLAPVRAFYLEEIETREPGAFLDGMVGVYIDSFKSKADHTRSLGRALEKRSDEIGGRFSRLKHGLPSLFQPEMAPSQLANLMLDAENAYLALKAIGLNSPHTSGLAKAASRIFVDRIAPDLANPTARTKLFNWLAPENGPTLQTGAGRAIEAILAVWLNRTPPDDLRNELSERIIAGWNDPRLHTGGIWSGFDPKLKSVLLGWLTRADMEFFCNVVTLSQKNHMWPPRRDFWLKMHDAGRIDEAWVAFSADAYDKAIRMIRTKGDLGTRFGRQTNIPDLSLLIMRIGNKIVVDGCHSYKTHVFNKDADNAPAMYQLRYDAAKIRRTSRLSQTHYWSESRKLAAWEDWVNRHV
ncbi:hypothetical protein B9057_05980 [Aestuarium zhoushanense]|nr:hypothetical protein B9057_05980 [Aestuarium zhoushanense]